MRKNRILPVTLALAFLVAACSSNATPAPADTSAPSNGVSPTNVASNAPTAAATNGSTASSNPTSSGAASGAPSSAPSAAAMACTPDAPTDASKDWSVLKAHDGDYTFSYPSTWEKLYGAVTFKTSAIIDPVTFAETGLPANAATYADLVRTPIVLLPNASVLIVPGVTSSNAVIFQRQVDRYKTISGITLGKTNLTGCLGGEEALGLELTFTSGTVPTYQQTWYVVHAGRSYQFQWLAPQSATSTDQFAEMIRTWAWTPGLPTATPLPSGAVVPVIPTAAPSAASVFTTAGIVLSIDPKATSTDPSAYVTTIPTTTKTIYAVWELQPGSTGRVEGLLQKDGSSLVLINLDYGAKTTWGNFKINSATGFAAGNYQMLVKFVPTGETIGIPFTVK